MSFSISTRPAARPSAARRGLALLALLMALAAPSLQAQDAPPANPYAATVTVEDDSNASRDKALRQALIDVLKRVVGRPDAAVSPILGQAQQLVQQYGFQRDEASGALSFRAAFDPASVDAALKANGLPVFGVASNVVEAWVTEVRGVRSSADYSAVLQHFAAVRGVRRVDVDAAHDDSLRLRMVVEGGLSGATQLAAGGRFQADGAGGYVLRP